MFSSYIYIIVIVVIAMVVIFGIFLFIKSISNSDKYYRPKNIKRKIEELEKKIAGNPRDYDSMYDLAVIQEQYNSLFSISQFISFRTTVWVGVLPLTEASFSA